MEFLPIMSGGGKVTFFRNLELNQLHCLDKGEWYYNEVSLAYLQQMAPTQLSLCNIEIKRISRGGSGLEKKEFHLLLGTVS